MMKISIIESGVSLERYANQLIALGDGKTRVAMARALNHEGDKGRTAVKRELVSATGIKYSLINRGMSTIRANQNNLEYTLKQKGNETNIKLFGAIQRKSGVSAAPWNVRRIFRSKDGKRGSFVNKGAGNNVYIREGSGRYPIRQLFGPNIAREIVKGSPEAAWEQVPRTLADRVSHELGRMLPG
jgi:hypothetical protein